MSRYIHFNWRGHSYAACCGTSIQPVIQTGAQMEYPRATVFLCLDNDRAGNMACERMAEEFAVFSSNLKEGYLTGRPRG